MKKYLIKSIEIYDGNWSSHYICPLGNIIVSIALIIAFISIAMMLSQLFIKTSLDIIAAIGLAFSFIMFWVGSLIGYNERR